MTPFYADDAVTLYEGDALAVLAELPTASVDAVVTDPPYGLEFMGRDWDSFRYSNTGPQQTDFKDLGPLPSYSPNRRNQKCPDCNRWAYDHPGRKCECGGWKQPAQRGYATAYQVWCQAWAAECLRVLKPGGHLLAFGGTRTAHRLTCAIEDAGFEIRDSIAWLYGSGFPKSLDVSKAIDKAASAQREVVGDKLDRPGYHLHGHDGGEAFGHGLSSSTPETRLRAAQITAPATEDAARWQGWGTALKPAHEPIVVARKPLAGTVAANVLAHSTGALNIDASRVPHANDADLAESEGKNRHADFGTEPGGNRVYGDFTMIPRRNYDGAAGRWPSNVVLDEAAAAELDRQSGTSESPASRPRSPDGPAQATWSLGRTGGTQVGHDDAGGASRFFPVFRYEPKAPTAERPRDGAAAHPTVKPLDLMRWLVRLVTPPGGVVLDPFAGSGTTAEACVIEGFRCITVEREPTYLPLIVARLSKPIQPTLGFEEVA